MPMQPPEEGGTAEELYEEGEVEETNAAGKGAAGRLAVKEEARPAARRGGAALKPDLAQHEIFVQKKRMESSTRDTACRAICKIKYGLRQPQAQEDGRPFIPAEWDKDFKPTLGSYVKFLLSRPDQFQLIEGGAPGLYRVEDITRGRTVVAPSWDVLATAKGKSGFKSKGKDTGKQKGKGPSQDGGKYGLSAKGKAEGKGKGKSKGKSLGKMAPEGTSWSSLRTSASQQATSARGVDFTTPRAVQLLAKAAREELQLEHAATEEIGADAEEEAEEEAGEAEDGAAKDEVDAEDDPAPEEEEAADEEADMEGLEDDDNATAKVRAMEQSSHHGSFIRSLLGDSFLGGAKRSVAGDVVAGVAKRAR